MALPTAAPAGVDPYAFLQFMAQMQTLGQKQANRQQNQQQNQQSILGQQNLQQQLAFLLQQQGMQQNFANQQQGLQSQADGRQFDLISQLLKSDSAANREARNANEERYNTILDRDVSTRNRLLDYTSQYGKSIFDDVANADKSLRGRDTAAMSAAGFLGASPDIMRGADITATKANLQNLNKAKDSLLQNAIGVDERTSNRLSDFQERRTDTYPNPSTSLQLATQLGQLSPTIPAAGSPGQLHSNPFALGQLPGAGGGAPRQQQPPRQPGQLYSNPYLLGGGGGGYGGGGGGAGGGLPAGQLHSNPFALGGGTNNAYGLPIGSKLNSTTTGLSSTASPTPQLHRPVAPQPSVAERFMLNQAPAAPTGGQQLPWNYGQPLGGNPDRNQPFTSTPGGQMIPLHQPMPALGIFGAGVQMQNTGGAPQQMPYSNNGGYSDRVPLWARDPGFANRLNNMGQQPWSGQQQGQQFQIAGAPTSVSPANNDAARLAHAQVAQNPGPTWGQIAGGVGSAIGAVAGNPLTNNPIAQYLQMLGLGF